MKRIFTSEHIENLRKAHLGQKAWNKGIKRTWKTGVQFQKGQIPWNKGKEIDKDKYPRMGHYKPHSEKTKLLLKEFFTGKKNMKIAGENNHFWKGGITKLYSQYKNLLEYRVWQGACTKKYKNICQICFLKIERGQTEIDHYPVSRAQIFDIYQLQTIEDVLDCKALWDTNNDRPVHKSCHKQTTTYHQD